MKSSVTSSKNNQKRIKLLYLAGALFFIAAAFFGICLGSTRLTIAELSEAFAKGFETPAGRIFLYVRLPRTAACLVCGGALAVSGAVIQCVLANRLASPSVIGVNAGAGLAVTLCTAFGIYGGFRLSIAAFIGAFLAVLCVSLSARGLGASRGTVILLGVAMNSFLNAISDAIVTLIPEVGVMSSDFRVGEFSSVTYKKLIPAAVIIILSLAALLTLTSELDVLTLGEESASGLGMNTKASRIIFLLIASLLAGSAVSVAGLLSFVGLIVPHAVRRISGSRSSGLIGLCALFGGGFVCLCDTAARTLFAPYEVPVGIIMAFLGAPFFVFILAKGKGGHSDA